MKNTNWKFLSATALLYAISFGPQADGHDGIHLDYIEQAEPWQYLQNSQQQLDDAFAAMKADTHQINQQLKKQLRQARSEQGQELLFTGLETIRSEVRTLRQLVQEAAKTRKDLHKQQKSLHTKLKQLKYTQSENESAAIEQQVMSLWQQNIGVGVEQLVLQEQIIDFKHQAIELLSV